MQNAENNLSKENVFTKTTNVVELMNKEGYKLELAQQNSADSCIVEGVRPVIYDIDGTGDQKIIIYEFGSVEERDKALSGLKGVYIDNGIVMLEMFGNITDKGNRYINYYYNVRNTAVFYYFQFGEDTDSNAAVLNVEKGIDTGKNIGSAIFKNINDGKTVEYEGKGKCWESKAELNYYQHYWKNNNTDTELGYEGWNSETWKIRYLGDDAAALGEFSVNIIKNSATGGGEATTVYANLDKDGYLNLGGTSGTEAFDPKGEYNITINWQGKSETIQLDSVNPDE